METVFITLATLAGVALVTFGVWRLLMKWASGYQR